jgi:hypothetical protein
VVPAQLVWAASILVALPVTVRRQWMPTTHVELLAGAAAAGSLFAELFMIKSLLVFDPDAAARERDARKRGAPGPDAGVASPRSPASPRYQRNMVGPRQTHRSSHKKLAQSGRGRFRQAHTRLMTCLVHYPARMVTRKPVHVLLAMQPCRHRAACDVRGKASSLLRCVRAAARVERMQRCLPTAPPGCAAAFAWRCVRRGGADGPGVGERGRSAAPGH